MKPLRTLAAIAAAGALAASLALAGCADSESGANATAQGDTTWEFNLGHLNSTAHVLGFVALEEGFFAEEGLNATTTQFSSQSELVSGLEAGKLDAAFLGSVPTLANQASGHDISIFGGAMSNGHGYVIDSKYTEGLDHWDVTILKGRTVAVPRTTIQELELYEILSEYGLTYGEGDDTDVKIVYFESQKDAYNALASDEIDAVSTYSPYTSIAVADGYSVVYSCSDVDIFKNQPCCRQVALTDALQADPEKYEAFERALIKAYNFFQTNREQTIQDVKKHIDIPEDQIEYELYTPNYAESNPDPDKQATETLKAGAVEFGYIEDFDLEPLYNTDIYRNALAAVIAENPDNTIYQGLQEHFDQYE